MKLGRKKREETTGGGLGRPALNEGKRSGIIAGLVAVTILLIAWVLFMGYKAQETVQVAVMTQNVYKNQVIKAEMLEPYDMLKAEYEKLSVVKEDGTKSRRVLLWSEVDKVVNSFAAYPLHKGAYAEYRQFVKSRVDNSDSVLYSFAGKEIIPLEVGSAELKAFKTFLQPGDKLNIQAIFSEKVNMDVADGYGGSTKQEVEVFKTETVFSDIMLADLLNQNGESILDIYASYNEMTVWQQAQLDGSASFKESTEPNSLLVALTPDELARYYYYKSKNNVEFKISMPQRTE